MIAGEAASLGSRGTAASEAAISRALRGAARLVIDSQEADGSFPLVPVQSRPLGTPGDNLFSTATVLALAPQVLPPERVSRAAAYLLERRGADRLWAWDVRRAVPADSDDTACCLAALAIVGGPLDPEQDARSLRTFWRWRGPFRTWAKAHGWNGRERDDAVVNCNVLWALRLLGANPRRAELRSVGRLVAAQQGATRYYCSPASVAWAAARAGIATPHLTAPAQEKLRGRALEIALWALAGSLPRATAAALLLDAQTADGGWAPEPWVQDHVGAWESRPVTAALAIAALRGHLDAAQRGRADTAPLDGSAVSPQR